MATKCDICGKGPSFGHNVSHANKKTLRRWNPNLQTIKIAKGGQNTKVKACTRCIRSGNIVKAA